MTHSDGVGLPTVDAVKLSKGRCSVTTKSSDLPNRQYHLVDCMESLKSSRHLGEVDILLYLQVGK